MNIGVEKAVGIVYNRGMKDKKQVFLCKLPVVNYVILGVMCAAMIPFAVVALLRLLEVGRFYSFNRAFDIVAMTVEIAATVFIVLLTVLTRYVVTDRFFIFQRIVATKIPIEKLLLVRHELSEDTCVLYYADERAPDGVRFVVLRVFAKHKQEIVRAIQAANPNVAYEVFDNSRKEEDE